MERWYRWCRWWLTRVLTLSWVSTVGYSPWRHFSTDRCDHTRREYFLTFLGSLRLSSPSSRLWGGVGVTFPSRVVGACCVRESVVFSTMLPDTPPSSPHGLTTSPSVYETLSQINHEYFVINFFYRWFGSCLSKGLWYLELILLILLL